MRPTRRAILVIGRGKPDPELPEGVTVIDRRVSKARPLNPWNPGSDVVELLIAGECLPEVPENCQAGRLTLAQIVGRTAALGFDTDGDKTPAARMGVSADPFAAHIAKFPDHRTSQATFCHTCGYVPASGRVS